MNELSLQIFYNLFLKIISKDKRNAAKAEAESCPDAEIHLDDDD